MPSLKRKNRGFEDAEQLADIAVISSEACGISGRYGTNNIA